MNSQRRRSTSFQLVFVSTFILVLLSTVTAEQLSVAVKVLPSKSKDDPAEMQTPTQVAAPPLQPTLPGGKLPQYQLGHHQRVIPTETELKDPHLRLLLALPTELVLIEAKITIDGQPFRMARENRIQKIIEEASRPAPPVVKATTKSGLVESDSSVNEEKPSVDAENTPADNEDVETVDEEKSEETPEESEKEPVAEPTIPPYAMATSVAERIRRYMEVTGEAASPDEVRWLMTNWVDGPVLLMLNDNFQRFRANQRPVYHVLDRDRDGTISAEELKLAVATFNECDLNRDDIVDYTEIANVADDPRLKKSQHAGPGKIIFQIPDEKAAAETYQRIAARYASEKEKLAALRFDLNSNGRFETDELISLQESKSDLSFTIAFDSTAPTNSRMTVTAGNKTFAEQITNGTATGATVQLPLGGTSVTFSAVQSGASDQISIGAVNDGYPILPVIDPNEDGRFTIRELRELVERLLKFDTNQDGNLTSKEAQSTIRICFGLGPLVHGELAGLRRINAKPIAPTEPGPEWFVRMDRNKDNDLTRSEFPGTDDQFKELDADEDTLISAAEAKKTAP